MKRKETGSSKGNFIDFMKAAESDDGKRLVTGFLGTQTPANLYTFLHDQEGYDVTQEDCQKLWELKHTEVKYLPYIELEPEGKCY